MKTTYRPFSSVCSAFLYAIAVTVSFLTVGTSSVKGQGNQNGFGGIIINTYNGITPTTILNDQPGVNTIVNGIMTGDPTRGWTFIPDGSTLSVARVFSSNGNGNLMNYGLSITWSSLFTLSEIQYSLTGVAGTTSGTFGSLGLTYDLFGVGINYGPDGIAGTADDVQYWTGNANTPVNAVYLLGITDTFNTGNLSTSDALHTWSPSCPFGEAVGYTLRGVSALTHLTYTADPINPVPEPTTFSIILLGVVGCWGYWRFKKNKNKL